ncbi:MAG: hypothetical protein ACYDDF_13830 [Thermoplasmatota archaeon]
MSAILAIGTGIGFATIGWLTVRRTNVRAGSAWTMFGVFWFAATAIWVSQGVSSLAGFFGITSLAFQEALDEVGGPAYCLAAASLLYYVLFILTGRSRLLGPILIYYVVVDAAIRYRVAEAHRLATIVGDWQVTFQYATPLQGLQYSVLVALLAVPLVVAVVAYGVLALRAPDGGTRYRGLLVATGLLVWVMTEALAASSGIAETTTGEVVRRVVALASTGVILLAYRPPAFAQRRWHVRPAL